MFLCIINALAAIEIIFFYLVLAQTFLAAKLGWERSLRSFGPAITLRHERAHGAPEGRRTS